MEARAKERLTGAAILVALVVLLVPELLTGPSRLAPAAGGRTSRPLDRSYIIDLDESGSRRHVMPVSVSSKREAPAVAADEPSGSVADVEESRSQASSPSTPDEATAVKAPVKAPPPIATAELPPVTGWSIQLGSFQSQDNAQRLLRELKGQGFSAFILEGGGTSGKLYRVRVGPAADRAAAAVLAAKLREAGQPGSIVPYP